MIKDEILNAIDLFGLEMVYDQWNEEGVENIRIESNELLGVMLNNKATWILYIHKKDIKTLEDALIPMRELMYKVGEHRLRVGLKNLMGI